MGREEGDWPEAIQPFPGLFYLGPPCVAAMDVSFALFDIVE
jgi:hypothetical protein